MAATGVLGRGQAPKETPLRSTPLTLAFSVRTFGAMRLRWERDPTVIVGYDQRHRRLADVVPRSDHRTGERWWECYIGLARIGPRRCSAEAAMEAAERHLDALAGDPDRPPPPDWPPPEYLYR